MATFSNFVNDPYLHEFAIELHNKDGCFVPGETIVGRVMMKSKQTIEIERLKVLFYGSAKLRQKNKGTDEVNYLNHELDAITSVQEVAAGKMVFVQFEQVLPSNLVTSVESKNTSVLYTIRAQMAYKTEDNATKIVSAVRGFTVVEVFDLNDLPHCYFESPAHHLGKKFGMFSCTGGQIKLHFTMSRSAFVCGENISIEGRIENKTDRRVDKVSAVLQQVIIAHTVSNENEASEASILDVSDIHEDNLALFVDEGQAIKIERNFAIPSLPPSTLTSELCNADDNRPFAGLAYKKKRRSLSASRLSFSVLGQKLPGLPVHEPRFLKILYQLSVRVKTGGVEVMEINVPIIIGSLPFELVLPRSLNQMKEKDKEKLNTPLSAQEKSVTFRQSRKDRPVLLAVDGEHYICNRAQLNFVNKYPFYPELPTSSKKTRKVNILANAIRAETNLIHGVRRQATDETSYSSEQNFPLPFTPMEN